MGNATRMRLNIERCAVLWIVMSLAGEITGCYYTYLSVNVIYKVKLRNCYMSCLISVRPTAASEQHKLS